MRSVHTQTKGTDRPECFVPRPGGYLALGLGLVLGLFGMTRQAALAEEPSQPREGSPEVTFESDILPLLTRFGCNTGPCHGKSRGQNGFALSLFGFDADFDYAAIVLESRGRRVQFTAPEHSLLLRKAIGAEPHGGGSRFSGESPYYEMIRKWIEAGAPRTPRDAAQLLNVRLEPDRQSLTPQQAVPLRVLAEYSDGVVRDVTDGAAFDSNDKSVATISSNGVVQAGELPGETAVMARYMNHISVCAVTIPLPGNVPPEKYAELPRNNEIDDFVWEKLKLLGMLPSPPASEATLHRRTYLRLIGRLPTADETRAYLADTSPDKRERMVDQLLARPEYADFWANKWADLLRPNPFRVGMKGVYTLDSWLRAAFRENKPYDEFVRELVTAQGSTWRNGATVLFRDRPQTVEVASSMSQLFLGIRLECAKCHHHPFEIWSQDDFYGFAAFFARVGRKGTGLSPPISGSEEMIFTADKGSLKHGRTGEEVLPKTLTGDSLELAADHDPREVLAQWMVASNNPYFPRVMANRIWAELMGLGLVNPVDDLRATNPASNELLLDYLAEDFRNSGYNIKHLIRRIALSHTFALSSLPGERNVSDTRNFSRYYRQRFRAEVLLDAVNDVLGTTENLAAMPPGSRAIQMWTHRTPSLFLDTFGRPDANLDPPYERSHELTTPQMLHLMNATTIDQKLSEKSAQPAKLAASDLTNEQVVQEIYLRAFSRLPTESELSTALHTFPEEMSARQAAIQDLFWALINTPEFYFID